MKIINISHTGMEIGLAVNDGHGNPKEVKLKSGCFIFTPTNEKTRAINLHGAKRNLAVTEDAKPDHLEYFINYTNSDLTPPEDIVIEENTEVVKVDKSDFAPIKSIQDMIDFGSKIEELESKKDESEDIFKKSKDAIGADEEQLYSELNLDAIKESVEEYVENKPTPKKRTTKSKRGPGRPKKRGPKPKKKSPGRPKGSKNKPKPKA